MININNGNLKLDNGVMIGNKFTKEKFMVSKLFNDVVKNDDYGYTWYYIKPQMICSFRFIITLLFSPNGSLNTVTLCINSSNELLTYNNYSEVRNQNNFVFHNSFLKEYVGEPPYKYNWGTIASVIDQKSGSSHIIIRYNPI